MLNTFRNIREVENYIAKKNGKMKNFLDKWKYVQGNI